MLHRGQLFGRFPVPPGPVGFLDGALIKNIQSGAATGTMSAQYGVTVDVTITAVNLSRAFVILPGGIVGTSREMVSARLTSTTNLRLEIQNCDNSYSQYNIPWMVIEADNISVQSGMLTQAVGAGVLDTAQTVTITSVNMSKAFILGMGCHRSTPTNSGWAASASYKINNSTTLGFILNNLHNTISVTINVPWQVIELLN